MSDHIEQDGVHCVDLCRLQAQDDLAQVDKERALAEHRASASEAAARDAGTQLRGFHGRIAALDAQAAAKDAELHEAAAGAQDARDAQLSAQQAHARLQVELRRTGNETAQLTARLGVASALSESKDVEIEELKAAVERGAAQGQVAGEALQGTAGEVKRLRGECGALQGTARTLVCRLVSCDTLIMRLFPRTFMLWSGVRDDVLCTYLGCRSHDAKCTS